MLLFWIFSILVLLYLINGINLLIKRIDKQKWPEWLRIIVKSIVWIGTIIGVLITVLALAILGSPNNSDSKRKR